MEVFVMPPQNLRHGIERTTFYTPNYKHININDIYLQDITSN